jgi:hypothetical protein
MALPSIDLLEMQWILHRLLDVHRAVRLVIILVVTKPRSNTSAPAPNTLVTVNPPNFPPYYRKLQAPLAQQLWDLQENDILALQLP